jgi:hydrogenase maturation protease
MEETSALVVGVGVPKRGDSSAGKWIIKRLMGKTAPGVNLVEQVGDGAFLVDTWRGYPTVILAGIVSSGAKPGTLFKLDACLKPLPPFFLSKKSPTSRVFEAVEGEREGGNFPRRLLVYGIEGRRLKEGDKISDEVKEATHKVAERILLDLRELLVPAAR